MPAEKSTVAIHISTMESAAGLKLLNLLNGRNKPLKALFKLKREKISKRFHRQKTIFQAQTYYSTLLMLQIIIPVYFQYL